MTGVGTPCYIGLNGESPEMLTTGSAAVRRYTARRSSRKVAPGSTRETCSPVAFVGAASLLASIREARGEGAPMLKLIRPLALFIMIAAMASSYHTQLVLFRTWEVDLFTAVIAPFAVDALAVICSIAIGAKGVSGKPLAATVLVVTLGGSMAANFIAGATLGSRIVHAGMVLIYLMAELVASRVRMKEAKTETVVAVQADDDQPAVQTTATEVTADEAASPDLPEAPVSPATGTYSERHERRLRRGK